MSRNMQPSTTKSWIENLKRLVMSKEIESVIQNFPIKKSLGPDGFAGEFD